MSLYPQGRALILELALALAASCVNARIRVRTRVRVWHYHVVSVQEGTVWLAEGLLMYLEVSAVAALLEEIAGEPTMC